jgi:Tfp pilus assembly protein PilF
MQKALEIDEKVYGPDHLEVAKSANNLGAVLLLLNDRLRAKKYLKKTLDIYQKTLGPYHPTTKDIQRNLKHIR